MDCIKNHKQGAEILIDYCAGSVDPAIAAEIDAHVQGCAECRIIVDAQRAVWETLEAWAPVAVSDNFDSRLYARIAQEQSGPAWRRWWSRVCASATPYSRWRSMWWKPMASLAVAAGILSLVVIARLPQPDPTVAPKSAVQKTVQESATKGTMPAGGAPAAPVASAHSIPATAASEEIDLQQVQQALDDLEVLAPGGQAAASPL